MYFVSEEHENYFYHLLSRYPIGQKDKEYRTGYYIVAHPEIYRYCGGNPVHDHGPFDWYFADSNKAGLSNGYRQLVEAGLNLYNGYKEFSVYYALGTWGDELFRVFVEACRIKRGNNYQP